MADTEKVTINMSVVDLGQVDLLVEEGYYSSRTDFIRTAIRNQLSTHREGVKQSISRKSMAIGVIGYNRKALEAARANGEKMNIRVVGMLVLELDIPPDLAREVIESVQVFGSLRASEAVKAAIADRIVS